MPTATLVVEPGEEVTAVVAESAPTPFMFDMEPTAMPVPAEPTDQPTCTLTINFNLNMRTEPSTNAEWILTIPDSNLPVPSG